MRRSEWFCLGVFILKKLVMKKLAQLVMHLPGLISQSGDDVPIQDISLDSRKVKPGDIFVAFRGLSLDGHKFIPDAIQAGAAAIVGSKELRLSVPYIHVEDSREALAYISAAFYDFPAEKLTVDHVHEKHRQRDPAHGAE